MALGARLVHSRRRPCDESLALHAPQVAEELDLQKGTYTILECEMSSLKSVNDFCNK